MMIIKTHHRTIKLALQSQPTRDNTKNVILEGFLPDAALHLKSYFIDPAFPLKSHIFLFLLYCLLTFLSISSFLILPQITKHNLQILLIYFVVCV